MQDTVERFPLLASITEQRELSNKLVIKPLREILGNEIYTTLTTAPEETQVTDSTFAPYFNPHAKDRQCYQQGNVLIVKEEINPSNKNETVDPAKKLYAVAVFEKSSGGRKEDENPNSVIFTPDDAPNNSVKKRIKYLRMKNLYLVKEGTEEAVDLAATWMSLPSDKGTRRRIGFLEYNRELSEREAAEAYVRSNSILLSDVDGSASYTLQKALGVAEIPATPKWMGALIAGAKSTQKSDIQPQVEQYQRNAQPNLLRDKNDLVTMTKLFEEMKRMPARLLGSVMLRFITGRRLSTPEKFLSGILTSIPPLQEVGFQQLVRLERNTAASTLYLIRQLRNSGFDLFPNISNTQLVQIVEETLKRYDELYSQAAKHKIPFASKR